MSLTKKEHKQKVQVHTLNMSPLSLGYETDLTSQELYLLVILTRKLSWEIPFKYSCQKFKGSGQADKITFT